MGESKNGGGSFVRIMKNLILKFSGKIPAGCMDWRHKTCLIPSIYRKYLVGIMKENRRQEGGINLTDESTTATHTLEQAQSTYDKASQDLYAILHLLTQEPAQLLVLKHEDKTGTGGNGQKAWQELTYFS